MQRPSEENSHLQTQASRMLKLESHLIFLFFIPWRQLKDMNVWHEEFVP